MLAHNVEAKRFMTLPHVRKVTRDIEQSSRGLALPQHFRFHHVMLTLFPLVYQLDACIDLAENEWRRQKRKLALGDQRRQAIQRRGRFTKYRAMGPILAGWDSTLIPYDDVAPLW